MTWQLPISLTVAGWLPPGQAAGSVNKRKQTIRFKFNSNMFSFITQYLFLKKISFNIVKIMEAFCLLHLQ